MLEEESKSDKASKFPLFRVPNISSIVYYYSLSYNFEYNVKKNMYKKINYRKKIKKLGYDLDISTHFFYYLIFL